MADRHRRIRAAAITGIGQLLGLLGSTLIGVLVAGTLPPSPRVDAFFAANQIYALALYLGQAVRITAPALLVRAGLAPANLNRAAGLLAVGTAAFMALVAVFATSLVAGPSRSAFTSDLLILSPAAAIHVASGALAARLSVMGSFGRAASAYAAGSLASGLLLLATISAYGAAALAPCIAAGGLTVGIVMVIGHRPHAAATVPTAEIAGLGLLAPVPPTAERVPLPTNDRLASAVAPGAGFAVRRIGLGSVAALAMQLLIAVVALAAGHVVAGGTSLLSYSFLALFAFTTIAITPMSIVLGPEVAERWGGAAGELAGIIRQATRLSVIVVVPLIVLAYFVGRPLAGLLLTALTESDLDQVFAMLAALCPTLLLTAAATAATVGITAADRLGTLASVLVGICVAIAVAGLLLATSAPSLLFIAAVAAGFALAFAIGTLYVAIGFRTWPVIGQILWENAPVFVPTLAVTALLAPLAENDLALGIALSIPVLALHAVIVAWLRSDLVVLLLGAARARTTA